MDENPNKINNWLLIRNDGGQKIVGQYTVLKENNCSTKNPISNKSTFQTEGKIKTFPDNKTWENSLLAHLPYKK